MKKNIYKLIGETLTGVVRAKSCKKPCV